MEKYIFDNYSLVRGVARDVRIEALRANVSLEFTFGRLDVIIAHTS